MQHINHKVRKKTDIKTGDILNQVIDIYQKLISRAHTDVLKNWDV